MSYNRYITAKEAVSRVLQSMTMTTPVSVSGSSDPTTKLLWFLLGEVGEALLGASDEWQMLNRTYTINTTAGVTEYALPSDFENFIDDTGWNNTARLPLIGPMTSQQWRLLQARQLGGTTFRLQYIIENDKLVLYHAPSDSQELTIEYKGRGWVQDSNDPAVYKDRPENDADIILYKPRLITAALKNRWRIEKGFDTLISQQEYDDALADAKYTDKPKSTLSLNGRAQFPYLGYGNMPDTGYGS